MTNTIDDNTVILEKDYLLNILKISKRLDSEKYMHYVGKSFGELQDLGNKGDANACFLVGTIYRFGMTKLNF